MTRTSGSPAPPGALKQVVSTEAADFDKVRFPDMGDLIGRLRFSMRDGSIWFDDQRMLLINAAAMGALRREMIETLGIEATRGFVTRMGYHAGTHDAAIARKVRSKMSLKDIFLVGPQLHCLEGIGLSEAIRLEFDVERGRHYGEFIWSSPVEDAEHLRHFHIGSEPACWMQIGYASGFSTEFMGRPVLYREVECQAMGQPICRIIGKTLDEWGDAAADDLRFLRFDSFGRDNMPSSAGSVNAIALPADPKSPHEMLVGISASFNSTLHMVRKVAPTQATVLFLGESGVGKEVFARVLHSLSTRSAKPFVALNCAAIPEHLVESELFGAERGAYTGATHSRPGRFERADGGTLFLDEIGMLSPSAQGKLLRVLQVGEIERLGDSTSRGVDVRVIAATNADLRAEADAGRFREDLFFRLNVFPIRIAPLRERCEDIPLLMTYFLAKFNEVHGRRLTGFTRLAVDAMLSYDWPGNVRELGNVIERGVILAAENGAIDASHLFTSGEKFNDKRFELDREGRLVASEPRDYTTGLVTDRDVDRVSKGITSFLLGPGEDHGTLSLDDVETMLLKKAVERAHGNVSAAARLLGITRPQMVYRLKTRGIAHESV